jgi:hypothetical protein
VSGRLVKVAQGRLQGGGCRAMMVSTNKGNQMSIPFYKLIILGEGEYEFFTDSKICMSLESAYRTGNQICEADNIYGYVIVEIQDDTWRVISESVYGCDYTVYEHNGVINVKKGADRIVMV